jgi:hypothetical protein
MITHKDQLDLFRIISDNIDQDVECFAFGGTAMMFYGYKEETKDVDIAFKSEEDRDVFIKALHALGFEKSDPLRIYIPEKLRSKNRPLMYKRGDTRFDLFAEKIIRTQISPKMKDDRYAVHDFKGKSNLKVSVLRKEHLVLLKAITERQNDFDDVKKILSLDKDFDWQYLVDEAVWQHTHGDSWMLLDIERTMQDLKKSIFIEEKYFRQVYAAHKKR